MRPSTVLVALTLMVALTGQPLRAETPAVLAPKDRLLVLPVRFGYYKYDLTSVVEGVPGKTELAQRNLESSLRRVVKRDPLQRYIELPELSVDEQARLREHMDLLRLAAIGTVNDRLKTGPAPWRSEAPFRFDYSIGDGLAFLADRTGADKAIFVSGARGEPSPSIAMVTIVNIMLNGFLVSAGNLKELSAVTIDLRSGDVLSVYMPERGFAGETADVAGANTWMRALFEVIPAAPLGELKLNGPPKQRKPTPHPRPRRGFSVVSPEGWRTSDSMHLLCFQRHGAALESICIDDHSLDKALRDRRSGGEVDAMQLGDIAMEVLKADRQFTNMQVVTLAPARIAGRAGFRAELASSLNLPGSMVRERHVVYGVASAQGAYLLRFDAPAIYYFDRHLPEFEALIGKFRLL